MNYLPGLASNHNSLDLSPSQVTGITDVSYRCPAALSSWITSSERSQPPRREDILAVCGGLYVSGNW
jgi:hypothetical protein